MEITKKNKSMKKYISIISVFAFSTAFNAQYLVVGKDSISVEKFKKENSYALEKVGVKKAIDYAVDFNLWQQFAKDKKADTLVYFDKKVSEKKNELTEKYFFPKEAVESNLKKFMEASKTETKIQVFFVQKEEGDKTDYSKIYKELKSGKLSMEEAIKTYTKGNSTGMFIKAGTLDVELEQEINKTKIGDYTTLQNNQRVVMFVKVQERRPSLGYLIFGTISYPNDQEAADKKQKIYEELKSGKKFEDVAAVYGRTEEEKKNGGVVMGSPTLPDPVYELLKNKKQGEYTQEPILLGDNWFVFNIYNLLPYELNDDNFDFFKRELFASQYSSVLYEDLAKWIRTQNTYEEYPIYNTLKKSYNSFLQIKNLDDVIYEYWGNKVTVKDFKEDLEKSANDNISKIGEEDWKTYVALKNQNDILGIYTEKFYEIPQVKEELDDFTRNLNSEYIYNFWLSNEISAHPEKIKEYYDKNKSKFVTEELAVGRVAILSDENMKDQVVKEIKNSKKWQELKNKYKDLVDDENKILVHLEEGEMPKSADVFVKYRVPFKLGIYDVKVGDRLLIIAIDKLQTSRQLNFEESKQQATTEVREKILADTLEQQRKKTNVYIDPIFVKELEKTYKK